MRKFEAGKRYESGAVKFEIVSRTAKQLHISLSSTLAEQMKEQEKQRKQKLKTGEIQSISLQVFTK